jgi:hypothetical protein
MSFLLDYADNRTELDESIFADIGDIVVATIIVVTGDEILRVVHRNGDINEASSFYAFEAFYDGDYDIIKDGKWVIDREEWDKRKTSYDFLWGDC